MGVRAAVAEAHKSSGKHAAVTGKKHGLHAVRAHQAVPVVLRMPPQYTSHDVECLLNALWGMFTESQAQRIVVAAPWDDSDEPHRMTVTELTRLLESWLD